LLAVAIEPSDARRFRWSADALRFMLPEWFKLVAPVAGGANKDVEVVVVSTTWASAAATAIAAATASASLSVSGEVRGVEVVDSLVSIVLETDSDSTACSFPTDLCTGASGRSSV
jgi:hypothetical protein